MIRRGLGSVGLVAAALVTALLWMVAPGARAALRPPVAGAPAGAQDVPAPEPSGTGPVLIVETARGVIAIETYAEDAPKTVAHVVRLVKDGFYDGLRFHRVEPGFVVQFGDPRSNDLTRRAWWGRTPGDGSGTPVGVAEIGKRRTHRAGAVAMAHPGDPSLADSQIYIALAELPRLDGRYTVFGQVIAGMEVVASLQPADRIERVRIGAPNP
jgi:cyclophilin family peptidyl-prolyl cis-trans isomerase